MIIETQRAKTSAAAKTATKSRVMQRFTATIAATALAMGMMTATAVPARADRNSDNIAKMLAVVAAIALIAKASDKKKNDDHRPDVRPGKRNPPVVVKPRPHVTVQPSLPRVCAIEVNGLRHDRIAYGERCLRQRGFDYRLPEYCAYDVRIGGRNDRVYPESCLKEAGFDQRGKRNRRD